MASTYLTRTFAQAGNRRTFTISYWIKMGYVSTAADGAIMGAAQDGSNSDDLYIHSGRLNFSGYYGSEAYTVRTTAKYRDLSGWYHHVIRFDSTQSIASDRVRLYVNGELQTALDNNTYPTQNLETQWFNTARVHAIGSLGYSLPGLPFNGSMSHFHFCDGYSYGADSFGQTDANGVWTIKTSPSVTYGTNGFFILKDGNSVTDQSGNGNNWSVGGGTLTNTEDNPSNVFATLNPLASSSTPIFGNGNTYVECNSLNSWNLGVPATLVMPSGGKFYWEVKNEDATYPNYLIPAFIKASYYSNLINGNGMSSFFVNSNGYMNGIQTGGGNTDLQVYRAGSNQSTESFPYLNGDIVSFAVDLVNRKAWFAKNGTWLNSGDPVNGTNETWSTSDIDANTDYVPTLFYYYTAKGSVNFGNGYFKTTAVASAGTNASGNGIFEYDVPTGFTALSTKGLNL